MMMMALNFEKRRRSGLKVLCHRNKFGCSDVNIKMIDCGARELSSKMFHPYFLANSTDEVVDSQPPMALIDRNSVI